MCIYKQEFHNRDNHLLINERKTKNLGAHLVRLNHTMGDSAHSHQLPNAVPNKGLCYA